MPFIYVEFLIISYMYVYPKATNRGATSFS